MLLKENSSLEKSLSLGKFDLYIISDGYFWIDGGSGFGIVPKVLWEKQVTPDERNRIKLAMNCLLIITPEKRILINSGIGEWYDEKVAAIYSIDKSKNLLFGLKELGLDPDDIDIVVATHMHFDHIGYHVKKIGEKFVPTFPYADYIFQKTEYEQANNPDLFTRASYEPITWQPISKKQIKLIEGDYEIIPGVKLVVSGGHTQTHMLVFIREANKSIAYWSDLIPTPAHLPIPYVTAFDLYPAQTAMKKAKWLNQAFRENWLNIFEHEPVNFLGYLQKSKGKYYKLQTLGE